ncbi:EpsG family protein [Enterocloster aldenensis]|uniref:EpsG family protein n=1 Tax=Enterocloster aldenensis TaxID=358742 RepID=UPI001D067700|nr:EpsG family protein [Enterocloster aldenensis]
MAVHIGLLIYICILGYIFFKNGVSKSGNRYFVIVSFIAIFLIQSMRGLDVGADTPAYIRGYLNINSLTSSWESQNWEKGYVLLNKIVGTITGNNPYWLLAIISAVILTGIGYFIIENTTPAQSAFWPVFFFVTLNHYLTSMVSLRQYCALAIGINIYTVLNKSTAMKSYVKSILLFGAAMSFHTSSIACLVIIWSFAIKQINQRTVLICIIACLIIYLNFDSLLYIAFKLFPRYYAYSEMGHTKFSGVAFSNTYTVFLAAKLGFTILVFMLNPILDTNQELYRLLLFSVIGAGISVMTTKVALIWRFGYYFDIFLILLIPKVIYRIKSMKANMFFICFLAGWSYYLYLLFVNTAYCIPYHTFWKQI